MILFSLLLIFQHKIRFYFWSGISATIYTTDFFQRLIPVIFIIKWLFNDRRVQRLARDLEYLENWNHYNGQFYYFGFVNNTIKHFIR